MFGPGSPTPGSAIRSTDGPNGEFCDPQLGCSSGLLAEDLSEEHSWQASQEFRLASHFSGPFNFSVGGNYMHYETEENYYVFINTLTAFRQRSKACDTNPAQPRGIPWYPAYRTISECLARYGGMKYHDPALGGGEPEVNACVYIDPNPIGSLEQPWAQLFSEPKSLHAEFVCRIRRNLLRYLQ